MSVQVPFKKTLGMYRRMLKSLMVVFDNDYEMFHRTRIEIRRAIEEHKEETDPMAVNELLFKFEETRRALLTGVI